MCGTYEIELNTMFMVNGAEEKFYSLVCTLYLYFIICRQTQAYRS